MLNIFFFLNLRNYAEGVRSIWSDYQWEVLLRDFETNEGKCEVQMARDVKENGDWLLHHDNAPAHTSLVVREFLTNNNMTTVPHPSYSPHLAPCDFYVFPKLKLQVKGGRYVFTEEIQAKPQQVLNTLTLADFNHSFQKW